MAWLFYIMSFIMKNALLEIKAVLACVTCGCHWSIFPTGEGQEPPTSECQCPHFWLCDLQQATPHLFFSNTVCTQWKWFRLESRQCKCEYSFVLSSARHSSQVSASC